MQGLNEAVVFLLRTTSLTLEDIRGFTPAQFVGAYKEASYQEQMKSYQEAHNAASIMAMIANCTPRKDKKTYRATDFIGYPPERHRPVRDSSIEGMVKRARLRGLKVPRVTLKQIEEDT